MPELPEVETLRRGLEHRTQGRIIREVVIANAKVLKGQSESSFRERVIGTTIQSIGRRGKFLLIELGNEKTRSGQGQSNPPIVLCIHLKMRGQLLLEPTASTPRPYYCVGMLLDNRVDGGSAGELRFHDMWTWGEIRAMTPEDLSAVTGIASMGPEPLDDGWNGAALRKNLGTRRGPIKPALLDQKVVAGVGNIYADESLFRCGIRPERPANSLTDAEVDTLAATIRIVLTEAVEGGGTTSEEYVDLAGTAGRYTPQVYDRGGAPCLKCGTQLTKIRLGGRGTVFCPSCQS